jgi:hypothetical protein
VQPVFHRTRQFLVECFVPGVDRRAVDAAATRAGAATRDLRGDGQAIDYLGAILLPSDEIVFHLFRAESREAVHAACDRAHVAYERVTDAVPVGGFHVLDPVETGPREDTPA